MSQISVVNPAAERNRFTEAIEHSVISACAQPGASVALTALK
jgi:hypothetical protein